MSILRGAVAAQLELHITVAGVLSELRQPLELAQVVARHHRPADSRSSSWAASGPAATAELEHGGSHRCRAACSPASFLNFFSLFLFSQITPFSFTIFFFSFFLESALQTPASRMSGYATNPRPGRAASSLSSGLEPNAARHNKVGRKREWAAAANESPLAARSQHVEVGLQSKSSAKK